MESHKIREIVREVLSEMEISPGGGFDSNNDISQFHGYPSGYGQFPYLYVDRPDMLPSAEDIKKDNTADFDKLLNNKEVYEFPIEHFKAGMDIETKSFEKEDKEGGTVSLYGVARVVLDNLENNKNFYQTQNNDSDENKRDFKHVQDGSA